MKIICHTRTGRWSLGLVFGLPVAIFIGTLFANFYYKVPAGDTLLNDLSARPLVGIFSIIGILFGLTASIFGLIAVFKEKERALLAYIPIIIGLFLFLFVLGEVF